MDARECENCGAALEKNRQQCAYCGTWYENGGRAIFARSRPKKIASIANLPQGVGEFGVSSNWLFVAGAVIALMLYILGWFFEDTQYWLNETAMLIWAGIMPLWLFGIALLWQASRKIAWYGLGISLVVFLGHILMIWIIRGNLWDDHVGIAGMVASTSLVGWLLGRLAHRMIRWRNAR